MQADNNMKLIRFHRFFNESFTRIKDLDLRKLENELDYPRDQIISNFIVYISLCKLLASENLHLDNVSLKQQTLFLEKIQEGGLDFD